jgi:hypothetical protein
MSLVEEWVYDLPAERDAFVRTLSFFRKHLI